MRLTGTLLSYAGGVLIAPFLFLPPMLPILILIAIGAWGFSRSLKLSTCSLILLFFCIGLFQYEISISPPEDPAAIHHLAGRDPVILEGVINAINARFPQGATCSVAITSSFADGLKRVQNGNLQLFIDQLGESLSPGDRIRFQTQLRLPRAFGTPGEFDYPRHLAHKQIFTTGFIRNSSDIVQLEDLTPPTPETIIRRWSQQIGALIDQTVPVHLAPYLRGLATGDRGALSPGQRELLAHSGLAHLFAISGLHIGIIASSLYILLLTGYRRSPLLLSSAPPQRILPIIILPVVTVYVLFTGGAISTLRALLGLAAVTAAFCLRRQVPPLQLLATAAFVILLLDPLAIFTPAFQLSFAGAAGILCITPRWIALCQRWPKVIVYPMTLLVVTTAATVATLPLVLLHFHIFAPAGIVLNMIAVPAVTLLAVPLCLTALIVAIFNPQAAAVIFNLAATILDVILNLCATVLALPGLSAHYLYLPPPVLAGIGLLALILLAPIALRFRMAGLTLAFFLLFTPYFLDQNGEDLSLVAISVGQGDAALVTTPVGKNFLIDGGGFSRSNFDTGERLVAPTLGYFGVREIEAVVLTHNHPDHLNGLLHILKQFPVHNFWIGTPPEELPEKLQTILFQKQIPIRTFQKDWTEIEQSDHSKTAVYRAPIAQHSRNDQSLVLYFQHKENGLLLCGDLETEGINLLSRTPPPGPVTLLKIPHHGSLYSNPEPLIDLFKPRTIYISAGYNNRYGHPHEKVLSLLENRAVTIHRTDLSGSLFFQTNGESWSLKLWDKGLFR
ncbi:MAG: DNA internalization-related competence protein ComEC/Rec2 [Desulfuromonadales bacterium]|nr:DNA internalization-related competence protein ComEC/Rec2 [Desulfuromonadales bacterium]